MGLQRLVERVTTRRDGTSSRPGPQALPSSQYELSLPSRGGLGSLFHLGWSHGPLEVAPVTCEGIMGSRRPNSWLPEAVCHLVEAGGVRGPCPPDASLRASPALPSREDDKSGCCLEPTFGADLLCKRSGGWKHYFSLASKEMMNLLSGAFKAVRPRHRRNEA